MKVKGYTFPDPKITNTFDRRALQFKNKIISSLRQQLGLGEDDVEVPLERVAIKKAKASAGWYFQDDYLYYSYNQCKSFVENLYVVMKVIEGALAEVGSGELSVDDFILAFTEEDDVEEQRLEARKVLGVADDCVDLDVINKRYKELAKKYHPDLGGDIVMFKKINKAHKMLKRELE